MCFMKKCPLAETNWGGSRIYASMQPKNMDIFRQTYQTTQDVKQMNFPPTEVWARSTREYLLVEHNTSFAYFPIPAGNVAKN